MNTSTIQQTNKFLQKVNIYEKNLLFELMTDKEYLAVIPFIRPLALRNYIICRDLDKLAEGKRRRIEHYIEIAKDYNLEVETLKKITIRRIENEAIEKYKAGESLRKIASSHKISYGKSSKIIKEKGLTRDPYKRKERLPYRESWIITEADIEEDFKTRIFK